MAECTNPKVGSLLHAYEMDGLSDSELAAFEAHMLECEACFAEEVRLKDATELMRDQREVKESIAALAEEESTSGSTYHAPPRKSWRDALSIGWLRPVPIAILLLIAAVSIYRFGSDQSETLDIQQSIDLFPMRGDQKPILYLDKGDETIINFVYDGAVEGRPYRLVITSIDGSVVFLAEDFREFDRSDVGSITIPLELFSEGIYQLSITDPLVHTADSRQEYYFKVESNDED